MTLNEVNLSWGQLSMSLCVMYGVMNVQGSVQQFTYRMHENWMIEGGVYESISSISARKCLMLCVHGCYSVNYDTLARCCEVNDNRVLGIDGTRLTQRLGWRLYEKEPCGLGFQSGTHCHHVIGHALTWFQAGSFCAEFGELLPEIRNEQEQDNLVTDVKTTGRTLPTTFWIGLNGQTNTWPSGLVVNYTFFADGQQIDYFNYCSRFYMNWPEMMYPQFEWLYADCNDMTYFICERRFD